MVVPVVVDDAATNFNVLKDVLKSTNDIDDENKLPGAALKFEPYFMHNDEKCFVTFCLPHAAKYVSKFLLKRMMILNILS